MFDKPSAGGGAAAAAGLTPPKENEILFSDMLDGCDGHRDNKQMNGIVSEPDKLLASYVSESL